MTHLETLFKLDGRNRILSTREPNPRPDPYFVLVRRSDSCAWAFGAGVSDETAREISQLALDEDPITDFRRLPEYASEYEALVKGEVEAGPAFEFPEDLHVSFNAVLIEDINLLRRSFDGWTGDEIPERVPIAGFIEDGKPVSICFCARMSETGVATVAEFRGRGLAGLVTSAWAAEVRASGRTPVYSTSWTNKPSLAVARRLNLVPCASYWGIQPCG